jgi:putative ABC transport system permease protein
MMERHSVFMNAVSEGSARALGMRLLSGRWISESEPAPVVVVNESMARRNFPSEDPVGRRVRLNGPDRPPATIVGVVADLKYAALDKYPEPEVYVPYQTRVPGRFTAVIRTSTDPAALVPALTRSASELDRAVPVFDVQTLEQSLADSVAPRRLNLLLLGVFGAAALGLALIGIYGVIAHSVSQRTHEIGVRMALGADRRHVVQMVVLHGAGMALAGIVVGLVAAAALTRVMTSLLYEVTPTDPQTFAATALGLITTAVVASLVPALRAARIDPMNTLR